MTTVSMISSKGGAGKTTTTLLLAMAIAERGGEVCIIDADYQQHSARWFDLRAENNSKPAPQNMHLVSATGGAGAVRDAIAEAQNTYPFVLVDVAGAARLEAAYAVAASDLVIIPMELSELDADGAEKTLILVEEQSAAVGRDIPHTLLLTKTSAIQSREEKKIRKQIRDADLTVLPVELVRCAPFKQIMGETSPTLADLVSEAQDMVLKKMTKANVRNGAAYERAAQNVSNLLDAALILAEGETATQEAA